MLPFYEYSTNQFQIGSGREMTFPPHLHSGTELLYLQAGEILTQHGGVSTRVQEGELIFFFPNEVHSYQTIKEDTRFAMFIYRGKLCEELEKVFATKVPQHFHLKAAEIPQEVLQILDILEHAKENHESDLIIKLYFELMWARLLPLLGLTKKDSTLPNDFLVSVLAYISEHFTEPLSLESLAKQFGVSRFKISRLFTHSIHVGLNDYVNAMRVDKAKSLLQNPNASVIDVAFSCGFESQQTFNRVFKNICGATPKEFRKQINV